MPFFNSITNPERPFCANGAFSIWRDNPFYSPKIIRMITKNIGMLLLAIYLIIVGLISLSGFNFGPIPGVLALIAGVLILLGK